MSTMRTLAVPRQIRLAIPGSSSFGKAKPRVQPAARPEIDPVIRGSAYFAGAVRRLMKYASRGEAEATAAANVRRLATSQAIDVEDAVDILDDYELDPPPGTPTSGKIVPSVQALALKLNVTPDEADRQIKRLAHHKRCSEADAASMLLSPDAGKRFSEPRVSTAAVTSGDFVTEARRLAADKKIRIDQAMSQIARDKPELHKSYVEFSKK